MGHTLPQAKLNVPSRALGVGRRWPEPRVAWSWLLTGMMRLGYVALSAVIGLAGVVFGGRSETPPTIAPAHATATKSDRVRIEHEIVQIPVSPAASTAAPRLKKAEGTPTVTPRVVTTRLARSDRKDPLLNRAVQRIVGDGRYAPQPFPRPGR